MGKKTEIYVCSLCGAKMPRWHGKCPECAEWNTIQKQQRCSSSQPLLQRLSEVQVDGPVRILTGIAEFDVVCGGGLVPGSVVLLGGEPGIGKSTLALQIAGLVPTLYVTGEESPSQIRFRADRLGINTDRIHISIAMNPQDIIAFMEKEKPQLLIVDSVQTLYTPEYPASAGTPTQIRESAAALIDAAKKQSFCAILIGHITKDGFIAGPKILEHMVDTVLYFEGDFSRDFRILRSFKNRFGSINEIGLFRMGSKGLEEMRNKNDLFLNSSPSFAPGSAITATIEGSRVIVFEVQSLVTPTNYSNPRRMADGFDYNRVMLITAVLEKHASFALGNFDIFINVAGGFVVRDTSADLAVAMAIASSLKNVSLPSHAAFLGEISLSGEIRPVAQCARRIMELGRAGFSTVCVAERDYDEAKRAQYNGEIIPLDRIEKACELFNK
ncbi:MAG: DNA repair protein RadA [Spirochaetes bacterium]|nr:DNA repair protein RadA [Spirochaetota bacterium]